MACGKRVTLQVDRHFAKRAKAVSNGDDPLQAAEPSFAALLRQSLFGKDELEALQAPAGKGLAPTVPRRVGRLCLESQGLNIHAATRVHECARDRLDHLVRYVCRPTIAANRLEAVGPRHARHCDRPELSVSAGCAGQVQGRPRDRDRVGRAGESGCLDAWLAPTSVRALTQCRGSP
ncbi:MAG: hypothetical protein FJ100_05570 [Deltaproteobacteria bacterium]|nr:hypothetical protein [Deltaproteobacteria bacterium]